MSSRAQRAMSNSSCQGGHLTYLEVCNCNSFLTLLRRVRNDTVSSPSCVGFGMTRFVGGSMSEFLASLEIPIARKLSSASGANAFEYDIVQNESTQVLLPDQKEGLP